MLANYHDFWQIVKVNVVVEFKHIIEDFMYKPEDEVFRWTRVDNCDY